MASNTNIMRVKLWPTDIVNKNFNDERLYYKHKEGAVIDLTWKMYGNIKRALFEMLSFAVCKPSNLVL